MTDDLKLDRFSDHELGLIHLGICLELSSFEPGQEEITHDIDGNLLPTREELELDLARINTEIIKRAGKLQ